MTCEWCSSEIPLKVPGTTGSQRTKYCSENCRKRAHEDASRALCHCGGKMGPGTAYASKRATRAQCRACADADRSASHEAHVQEVARLYNLGLSIKEIAAEFGWGEKSKPPAMVEAHRRGLIGYRNRGYE